MKLPLALGAVLSLPLFIFIAASFNGNDSGNASESGIGKDLYLRKLEAENGIAYYTIDNYGGYIPPMCYTKTEDEKGIIHNPCYTCHTPGKPPNFWTDTELQEAYDFPNAMLENPYKNLFTDATEEIDSIDTKYIYSYIRKSNYFDTDGKILLQKLLPKDWKGYVPDCYFNFDEEGFDRNPFTGEYTGWRAYQYYPFPGTFWPTNGSIDDVMIRLPMVFRQNEMGEFDKEVYKKNLEVLDRYIKQEGYEGLSFVGMAGKLIREGKLQVEPGLFPQGTEFLHTVRYLDWDDKLQIVKPSPRMKEVRYAYKEEFYSSTDLYSMLMKKYQEQHPSKSINTGPQLEAFPGDFERGMRSPYGWRLSGFIEDKNGYLRPQTNQETLYCMGCHGTIGATTDGIFSFTRKFGWGYWKKTGLRGIPEPIVHYKNYGNVGEYSFYLKQNYSGNEFRSNEEVIKKFFSSEGTLKQDMLDALKKDVSVLLYPSKERAERLNKTYLVIVKLQKFTLGRETIGNLEKTIYRKVYDGQKTGIREPIF